MIVNGKVVTGSATLDLPHGQAVTLDFNTKGKTIGKVLLNGEDITARLSGGRCTITPMEDMTVTVSYAAAASPASPFTGDAGSPVLFASAAACLLLTAAWVAHGRKKRER